jgi:hypothetical protein
MYTNFALGSNILPHTEIPTKKPADPAHSFSCPCTACTSQVWRACVHKNPCKQGLWLCAVFASPCCRVCHVRDEWPKLGRPIYSHLLGTQPRQVPFIYSHILCVYTYTCTQTYTHTKTLIHTPTNSLSLSLSLCVTRTHTHTHTLE